MVNLADTRESKQPGGTVAKNEFESRIVRPVEKVCICELAGEVVVMKT